MNQTKIAVIGGAGAGKNFVADIFTEYFDFKQYAFASAVNETARNLFPEQYGDGSTKPRKLLQDVGTYMREIDPNVWINILMRDIYRATQVAGEAELSYDVIITDVRMPNEYARLESEGYFIILVTASPETRQERMKARGDNFDPKMMEHETESHWNTFIPDFTIDNDGPEILTYAQVVNFLTDYAPDVLDAVQ